MSYFEFPHTRTYDSDLGWLIKETKALLDCCGSMTAWRAEHEAQYKQLKNAVESLVDNLVDGINPWDSSIEYKIYSIVSYQGSNYIAIQDVPVGVMITNTDYWTEANTVLAQIGAIGATVDQIQNRLYFIAPEDYGAVGDGTTDDTIAIQSAINAAAAAGIPFKCLHPKYMISSSLYLPAGADGAIQIYDFCGASLIAASWASGFMLSEQDRLANLPSFIVCNLNLECRYVMDGINYGNMRRAIFKNIQIADVSSYAIYGNTAAGQILFDTIRAHCDYTNVGERYFAYIDGGDAWFSHCYYQDFKFGFFVSTSNVFIDDTHGYPSPHNYVGSYFLRGDGTARVTALNIYPDSEETCIIGEAGDKIHVTGMQNFFNFTDDLPVITTEVMALHKHTIARGVPNSQIVICNSVIWQEQGDYAAYCDIGNDWFPFNCSQLITGQTVPKSVPITVTSVTAGDTVSLTVWNGTARLEADLTLDGNSTHFIGRIGRFFATDQILIYPVYTHAPALFPAVLERSNDPSGSGAYALRLRGNTATGLTRLRTNFQI